MKLLRYKIIRLANFAFVGIIFLAVLLTFVGCAKEKNSTAVQLATPEISYNGSELTWSAIANATGYKLTINDGQSQELNATKYAYMTNESSFSVQLVATSLHPDFAPSTCATKTFTALGKVQNIRLSCGKIVWDEVPDATAYIVNCNDQTSQVASAQFDLLNGGENTFFARAIVVGDDSYYSADSESVTFDILAQPQNIAYSKAENKIAWSRTPNAKSYVVSVNGEEYSTQENSLPFSPPASDFEIAVKAISGQPTVADSAFSPARKYKFLPPPTKISAIDGNIEWDAVDNCVFQLQIKDLATPTQPPIFTDADTPCFSGLRAGVDYSISIRTIPTAENEFSTWSQEQNVFFLTAPKLLFDEENAQGNPTFQLATTEAECDKIGAFCVLVVKDGIRVVDNQTISVASFCDYDFASAGDGEYKISARAFPKTQSENSIFPSLFCEQLSLTRLANIQNLSLSTLDGDITFDAVQDACGYKIMVDNKESVLSTNACKIAVDCFGEVDKSVDVSVVAQAKASQSANKYFLPSALAARLVVTRFAQPIAIDITNGVLSWQEKPLCKGYNISLDGEIKFSKNSNIELDFSTEGTHTVAVQSLGSLTNANLPSAWSESIAVVKLATPQWKDISPDGIISWTSVGLNGYALSIGDSPSIIEKKTSLDLTKFPLSSARPNITLQALADGKAILDSNIVSSYSVSQLRNVKDLECLNETKTIAWFDAQNAKQYNYLVEKNNVSVTNELTNDSSFSVNNINCDGACVIKVRASAYFESAHKMFYLPSEYVAKDFVKLPKISAVTRHGKAYSWASVNDCCGYEVTLPQKPPVKTEKNTIEPSFSRASLAGGSTLQISFVAVGDDAANVISSTPLIVYQQLAIADTPTLSLKYSNGKYTATATNNLRDKLPCEFVVNKELPTTQLSNVFEYCANTACAYAFSVRVLGDTFVEDVFYLTSDSSAIVNSSILAPAYNLKCEFVASSSSAKFSWENDEWRKCHVDIFVNRTLVKQGDDARNSAEILNIASGDRVKISVYIIGSGLTIDSAPVELEVVV
ncbi:MAG: hypothetical protein RSB10_03515 [Clostridia bacterium]